MNQSIKKEKAAQEAQKFVPDQGVLGVGTGSTVEYFIQGLHKNPNQPEKIISSSKKTTQLLKKYGYDPVSPNEVSSIDVYVDGADEVNASYACIKGAGGAMTLEKLLVLMSKTFICIVDDSKLSNSFSKDTCVPIEVIPSARSFVARKLASQNSFPVLREGTTDLGNVILDVYQLDLIDYQKTSQWLSHLFGVVGHGLFTEHIIDVLILANDHEVSVSFSNL